MKRPRLRLASRTRRGDGFGTEISVVNKPERGMMVRVVHNIATGGQYVFDYYVEEAAMLGRDLVKAANHARELAREQDLATEREVQR